MFDAAGVLNRVKFIELEVTFYISSKHPEHMLIDLEREYITLFAKTIAQKLLP